MFNLTFQFGNTFVHFTKKYDNKDRAELIARKYAQNTNAKNWWIL